MQVLEENIELKASEMLQKPFSSRRVRVKTREINPLARPFRQR
jgi:hypothetical protein